MAEQPKPQAPKPAPKQEPDRRYLVRVANTDLNGNKSILYALKNIKGVSVSFANAVCRIAEIDGSIKAGDLKEDQIKKIDGIIAKPLASGVPKWMFNRQKDIETGETKHLITSNLQFQLENDIKRMKMIKSYKGVRHAIGQPVRGQRTRSNFRRNKGKVLGVSRSAQAKPKPSGGKS